MTGTFADAVRTASKAKAAVEVLPRNKGGRPRKVKPEDAEKPKPRRPLLTRQDVANDLNVNIRFTYTLQETDPDFPEPVILGPAILRWEPDDIDRYRDTKRTKSLNTRARAIAAQQSREESPAS